MYRLLVAYGARVHVVDSPHPAGGWQEARRQRVGELLAEHPGSFGPDQYNNPDNVAGYAPLAWELVAQLGRAVRAARLLAGAQYASGGWSVGAVALVAGWLASIEEPDVRIAAVFPDGPQRYFDTVFNDDYCHRHGLLTGPAAAVPPEAVRRLVR